VRRTPLHTAAIDVDRAADDEVAAGLVLQRPDLRRVDVPDERRP